MNDMVDQEYNKVYENVCLSMLRKRLMYGYDESDNQEETQSEDTDTTDND